LDSSREGEDDRIPVKACAMNSVKLINGAQEIYYPAVRTGLTATNQDQIICDTGKDEGSHRGCCY
jgi:non-heme chloroperoxidase